MLKKIYVGNLPYAATEEQLRELFAAFGTVVTVTVMVDKQTGRSRGFGFVQMEEAEARAAIAGLEGVAMASRTLRVSEARSHEASLPR